MPQVLTNQKWHPLDNWGTVAEATDRFSLLQELISRLSMEELKKLVPKKKQSSLTLNLVRLQ